jgi:uncharacterized protein YcbK (DUF882 family)
MPYTGLKCKQKAINMITVEQILKGHSKYDTLPVELKKNLQTLLERVNDVAAIYPGPLTVNSGYRPPEYNAKIGGAPNSWHCKCAAVDFADKDGALWTWCMAHLPELAKIGLWLEDKSATKTWVHMQIYPPKSGARIFKP